MNSIIWIPWHHWLAASEVMNMPDIWSTEEAEADILDIWDQLHWLQSQKATDLWFLMAHMLGFDWNLELSCKFHELCAFVKLIMLLRCQDVKVKRFMTYCDTMTQGLDRVLFVHSSGHEVREVSTWRCRKSNTKKIWGCFTVSICTIMICPFLLFSQDRHKSIRPDYPHLGYRFVNSADFSYVHARSLKLAEGLIPVRSLRYPSEPQTASWYVSIIL